jgi:hypothetical protein
MQGPKHGLAHDGGRKRPYPVEVDAYRRACAGRVSVIVGADNAAATSKRALRSCCR